MNARAPTIAASFYRPPLRPRAHASQTDAKIIHKSGEALSDFEKHVDSFLRDIEKAGSETLKGLRLEGAKEVTVSHTQKACVLVAPFPQLVAWRKNFKQTQEKLEKMMPVRECEGANDKALFRACTRFPFVVSPASSSHSSFSASSAHPPPHPYPPAMHRSTTWCSLPSAR